QLHPRPQAALADFFCALALSGRRAIVETHSELFFHRLRLRAALNHQLADQIAAHVLDCPDKDGYCRPPRELSLKEGAEVSWPEGFLIEGIEEQEALHAANAARKRGKK